MSWETERREQGVDGLLCGGRRPSLTCCSRVPLGGGHLAFSPTGPSIGLCLRSRAHPHPPLWTPPPFLFNRGSKAGFCAWACPGRGTASDHPALSTNQLRPVCDSVGFSSFWTPSDLADNGDDERSASDAHPVCVGCGCLDNGMALGECVLCVPSAVVRFFQDLTVARSTSMFASLFGVLLIALCPPHDIRWRNIRSRQVTSRHVAPVLLLVCGQQNKAVCAVCCVLCRATQCCAVPCRAGLHTAVLCCAVLHSAVLCCGLLVYCGVLCCACACVLCCAVLCCAVLCCAVLCFAVLCCAVLCCVVLCCVVPRFDVRHRASQQSALPSIASCHVTSRRAPRVPCNLVACGVMHPIHCITTIRQPMNRSVVRWTDGRIDQSTDGCDGQLGGPKIALRGGDGMGAWRRRRGGGGSRNGLPCQALNFV